MASRGDKKVADATTKLGRTIAGALRSWAKEVGADRPHSCKNARTTATARS